MLSFVLIGSQVYRLQESWSYGENVDRFHLLYPDGYKNGDSVMSSSLLRSTPTHETQVSKGFQCKIALTTPHHDTTRVLRYRGPDRMVLYSIQRAWGM